MFAMCNVSLLHERVYSNLVYILSPKIWNAKPNLPVLTAVPTAPVLVEIENLPRSPGTSQQDKKWYVLLCWEMNFACLCMIQVSVSLSALKQTPVFVSLA